MNRMILELLANMLHEVESENDNPNVFTDSELVKEVSKQVGIRTLCEVHTIKSKVVFVAPTGDAMEIESSLIVETTRTVGINKSVKMLTTALVERFIEEMLS